MKKFFLLALATLVFPALLLPQTSSNLQLVAHINPAPGTTYSEVTGCGDLAIIGAFQGNSFVWIYDLADQTNPALLAAIQIQQACLDVQVHGRYLFISFSNGMAWYDIIDPRQPKLVHDFKPAAPGINAHTSFVSGNTLYIADQVSDGVRIFDITDKRNPTPLADLLESAFTIHDMTIMRGRLYGAWIFGPAGGELMLADVRNPANPRVLARARYPQAGTHNAWPTEDEKFVFSTDEVNNTRHNLKIWDARTSGQLNQVAEFTAPNAGSNATVHNVYVRGRYAYMSYYCEGVHIIDIADPTRSREVAFYDLNGNEPCNGYDSNWGVDPFSDLIYASDMQQGLFVLEFPDHPPANVAGRVLDAATQNPVSDAVVYFLDEYPTTRSKANGNFGMVWFKDDTVRVVTEALGYRPDTTVVITRASSPTPLTIYLNGAPRLTIANAQIDDDNTGGSSGNGNGVIDAIETYELRLTVQNRGFAALASGAFRLRSSDPYVRISDSLQTVGAIGINQTAALNGALRFSASPVTPVNHQLSFKLLTTLNNQIIQEIDFALPAQPPLIDGFRATTTANSVTLHWRPVNDTGLNGYHLYRKLARQADADFAKITATVVTDTTFTVTGLITGEVLNFAITKVVGGVESLAGARLKVAVRQGVPQILVVNGIDWETYGAEMTAMYAAQPFNAGRIFDTWDVISEGLGFPEDYLLVGETPQLTFDELRPYQAVVWVGNNFNGDLDAWRASLPALKTYLDNGGRLVLITRLLAEFLLDDDFLQNYLHLSRSQIVPNVQIIQQLNPLLSPLVNMQSLNVNSLNSGWQNVSPNNFVEPIFYLNFDPNTIMGVRARTKANGPFNLVVISGRPYRFDSNALRTNMAIIINNWFGLGTEVDEPAGGPESFALLPNYPNPFTPAIGAAATQIVFSLPQREKVQLEIFNVLGQRVRELLNAPREQGQYAIAWDGTNDAGQRVAAGVYVLRLRSGKLAAERKLTLVR